MRAIFSNKTAMKKLILTTLFLLNCLAGVFAQSETTSFDVGGIKVIFKPTTKNVINVRMYYRGGVTNYSAAKAGLEHLTLAAATQCGTKKYSPNAFKDTADKYDVLIYGKSTYDYGFIQVNCITKYFDKGWDLFTEAVNNPVFDSAEVASLKNKVVSLVKRAETDPYERLWKLNMRTTFANTPYATDPVGTEQALSGFTGNDLMNHYKTILNKNRIFIVVVGNISKQELYEKITLAFDGIRSQPYSAPDLTMPALKGSKLFTEYRDLKTNYISAVMNAPEFTSNDYVPFRLAISGLGGNLFQYLRSKQNIASNPGTNTVALKMPFSLMEAATINPQQTMYGMLQVLKRIQTTGYDEEWLQHIKNGYITINYINDQSASQITNNLGLAEVLGNWHYADDLPQLVNMVTVDQLSKVINAYITGIRWNYLGNVDIIEGFKPPAY
jgi:zinc protease